jgi:hypothetical protein
VVVFCGESPADTDCQTGENGPACSTSVENRNSGVWTGRAGKVYI